nr:MAG: ORF1 [TTV-like mini virus]
MPPFRRNYWRKWWPQRRRYRKRLHFRRRRPRSTFYRGKRKRWVRRRRFKTKFKKKLKKIILNQWQPTKIRRCKITGYLPLFEFGPTRAGNNFAMFRDSFVPPHEPGGGGWSVQQITLSSLYFDNVNYLINWWTTSNRGLNLLRYMGCEVTLFRQPTTDYIFSYFHEQPRTVSKYYYAGLHPVKMLNFNQKVVVPSFKTQPHKQKPYKRKFIPPPKLWTNKWYFQQQICDYPLIQFTSTCCDLTGFFGSRNATNNNISLFCLNTSMFQTPHFQYRNETTPYKINGDKYMYSLQRGELPITSHQYKEMTLVGQTMLNEPGFPRSDIQKDKYTKNEWGNPFYYAYMNKDELTFVSSLDKDAFFSKTGTQNISATDFKLIEEPFFHEIRYNPWKDKGTGNKAYWITNLAATKGDWNPTGDPDLEINDFPFWIMLFGWEEMTARIGKAKNINNDYILVLRSSYFDSPLREYVILSESFVNGQGPYGVDRSEIKGQDQAHWYPRFRYQREAMASIVSSGPAISKNDYSNNQQALIKYKFYFKWGGCPSAMENIYDPKAQPITPTPNNLDLFNEITDPQTSIENYIYPWDTRRDQLTQAATERITKSPSNDSTLFTDGKQSSTDLPIFQKAKAQEEETPQTQAEALLLQLNQLQQLNQQLQQRFNNLTLQLQNT